MKKFLAVILAMTMVMALVACGSSDNGGSTAAPAETTTQPAETGNTDAAPAAEALRVAMVTDYGDITDQSFNQTTYEAAKSWSEANGADFTYFKPASDSDDDRVAMIEKAIDEGYEVIVMPGYAFAPAIAATAPEYSDVIFIGLDVSEFDLTSAGLAELPENLYCAVYQEELCGYMAGYAAVKMGYSKLGFLGGMAVPAVVRYGYGFVQGADAAAAADGKTDVTLKYAYGNQFYGDGDITAAMDTWYADGTEVVFACGGGIFTSAAEAAAKVNGKVIGVDVDQAGIIDGQYGAGMTVTSAMKGLAATVNSLLTAVNNGSFAGGIVDNLGLVSANPEENYVQLPLGSTQWSDSFSQADYTALVGDMFSGAITVSNDITATAADMASTITVTDLGNLK
ncbi:MAG: BMP family ABC transporter substrate-binding protein [Oscillospiraceae bacterium]|nr:BMP family ABC transporter substrate-binding protein [Oscillospiraceae bacterium]